MFTGIIQRKGTVVSVDIQGASGHLVVASEAFDRQPIQGDSIAVSGVCLTLTKQEGNHYHFDVLAETFEKTNLGDRQAGDAINLEPSLKYGDHMGGHIVTGHIDGTAEVAAVDPAGDRDHVLRIHCTPELAAYMVQKGSVAMDGVSLTLVDVTDTGFSVHIIPHTWEQTSFCTLKPGSRVNIENDVLSKYVLKHMQGKEETPLTWEVFEKFRG